VGRVIDGRKIAAGLKDRLRAFVEENGLDLTVVGVVAGGRDADRVYVRMRERAAAEVGASSRNVFLPPDVSQGELLDVIKGLNEDDGVDGIIVHFPLPPPIDRAAVAHALSPVKDVDGITPFNRGRLFSGDEVLPPATPAAVVYMLNAVGAVFEGREVVVVNHSEVVGKPLAVMLLNRNATVHVCHVYTRDLARWTKEAEVLVTGAGVPDLIKPGMIREGAVVVDVAMNRLADGSLRGDVEFDGVLARASYVTPVPGGVGPVTNAMLLRNLVRCALLRRGEDPLAV